VFSLLAPDPAREPLKAESKPAGGRAPLLLRSHQSIELKIRRVAARAAAA